MGYRAPFDAREYVVDRRFNGTRPDVRRGYDTRIGQ